MKVYMITDTHFGIYINNMEKWLNMMESTFYNFVIPFLKKNVEEGDVLIHLGDLFDNRTSIPIIILNKVEKILKDLSDIIPVHIMVGNHDLFNKGSNDINSVRIFSYMKNISVYEKTKTLEIFGTKLVLMPWVEKRIDMIKEINSNPGDYLLCHSDLNGCLMHLNSVAHRNADKIDILEFKNYKRVFSGHVHIRQISKNFEFIGSLWQMDRNDMGDQKGITVLDLPTGKIKFIPNDYSPVFKKVLVKTEDDIDELDLLKDSSDYIDLTISNNLLVSNRKLRRKLETLLEVGNFASVEYLDDIVTIEKEPDTMTDEELQVSIQLDYEEVIRSYIGGLKFDNDKFKDGMLKEFDEIIRVYNENYKVKD